MSDIPTRAHLIVSEHTRNLQQDRFAPARFVELNGSTFTVPPGNLAETSNSPPKAFTIRRRVEICISDSFSNRGRLG